METYDVVDLFSGIGGIRLGLEQTGRFKVVHACEIDKNACKTYAANFGHNPYGDVTQIVSSKLPDFDVLAGGFPCQSFSAAGERLGFEDTRGTLFFYMAKIMNERRPKAGIFENVHGLMTHDYGKTLGTIMNALTDMGYKVDRAILNARDHGLAQNRPRVYIVAMLPEYFDFFQFPPGPTSPKRTLQSVREPGPVADKYYLSAKYLTGLERHRRQQEAEGRGFGYEVRSWDSASNAVLCGGMGKERNLVVDEAGPMEQGDRNDRHVRKLTPREWARLQGFPDEFRLPSSDGHAYRQLGNSVAVPVIRTLGERLAAALDKKEREMEWSMPR
jgi:DNA (cytosine-5)-methyltransferase 1